MQELSALTPEERAKYREELDRRIEAFRSRALALDMTRGKPAPEQLDLANESLSCVDASSYLSPQGTDTRNYGGLDGLPEAKELFSEYMGVDRDEIPRTTRASMDGQVPADITFDQFLTKRG